jgi:hypothetical protein
MTRNDTCESIHIIIDDLTQNELVCMQIPKHISEHARSCVFCKSYLDQQIALATEVEQWTVPEPKKPICAGVMTQIAQMEHDKSVNTGVTWAKCVQLFKTRVQVPAAVAAMLLMLLAVSVVFNISSLRRPDVLVQQISDSFTNPQPENTQMVEHAAAKPRILPATHELSAVHPWLSQTQLPAGTMVIILGAPPLPWTESLPKPVHNQSHSL